MSFWIRVGFLIFFSVLLEGILNHAWAESPVQPTSSASYFVSIKAQSKGVLVNVRSGPGQHYPLEWQLVRARWPLEVLRKFEHWRQVRDADGSTGWVHQSMLSGKRSVVFVRADTLYKKPEDTSAPVAQVEEGVIAHPLVCEALWCKVRIDHLKGWVQRSSLWGIYAHETKF